MKSNVKIANEYSLANGNTVIIDGINVSAEQIQNKIDLLCEQNVELTTRNFELETKVSELTTILNSFREILASDNYKNTGKTHILSKNPVKVGGN